MCWRGGEVINPALHGASTEYSISLLFFHGFALIETWKPENLTPSLSSGACSLPHMCLTMGNGVLPQILLSAFSRMLFFILKKKKTKNYVNFFSYCYLSMFLIILTIEDIIISILFNGTYKKCKWTQEEKK